MARIPIVVAVPLVAAVAVWRIGTWLFGDGALVFFSETPLTIELTEGSAAPQSIAIHPEEPYRIPVSRGTYSIRIGANTTTTTVNVGASEAWVVPTSPDQCFMLVDVQHLFRGSAHDKAVVTGKLTSHAPERIDMDVHAGVRNVPSIKAKGDPVVVDAIDCAKLQTMSDSEIVAALAQGSPATAAAREASRKAFADEIKSSSDVLQLLAFKREVEAKGWNFVSEIEGVLVFKSKGGFALYRRSVFRTDLGGANLASLQRVLPSVVERFEKASTAPSIEAPGASRGIVTEGMLELTLDDVGTTLTTPLGPADAPVNAKFAFRSVDHARIPLTDALAKALDLDADKARTIAVRHGASEGTRALFGRCQKELEKSRSARCSFAPDAPIVLATLDTLVGPKKPYDVELTSDGITLWKPNARKAKAGDPAPLLLAHVTWSGDTIKWQAIK